MKKVFFLLSFSMAVLYSAAQKQGTVILTPGPASLCNCDVLNISSNMWIEGSAGNSQNYILEMQIPVIAACPVSLDSLYFITVPGGLVRDRFNSFREFVKVLDKTSGDKKWHTIRWRIPKSIFLRPPVLNQAFGASYKIKLGTKKCTPLNTFKITDELL